MAELERHPQRNSSDAVRTWLDFVEMNCVYRKISVSSQLQYEMSLIDQLRSSPKLFHSFIKHMRIGRPAVGPLRLPNGKRGDEPSVMATMFVQTFASVFHDVEPSDPAPNQLCDGIIHDLVIIEYMIEEILKALNPNTSVGSDGIPSRLLKKLAQQLAQPFCSNFMASLTYGSPPLCWRSTIVAPIYKKQTRYDPLNYRHISLTLVTCKSMEIMLATHIINYLTDINIL